MFSDKKYLTASQLVPPGKGCSEQCRCSQWWGQGMEWGNGAGSGVQWLVLKELAQKSS